MCREGFACGRATNEPDSRVYGKIKIVKCVGKNTIDCVKKSLVCSV